MNYAIEAVRVCKSLGNKPILSDITIRVRQGAIYGFLGANGAGKTSFLKILMGLWNMDSGSVALLTHNLKEGHEVYKHIGSIIETPVFYSEFSARKNLEIHCDYLDKNSYEKINSTLQLVGIGEEAAKPVREFSLGMKQRLAIGRALLADPKLLVLDEPTNGLDPHGIKFLRELLCKVNRSLGTTIIISSHILDEVAKVADVIGIIHQGKMLAEVPIEAVGKDIGDLEAYYFNLIKECSNDQLICNECKRAKFGQYVLIIAIGNLAALFLAISSSSMLNHTSYGIQAFAPGMPAFSLSTVDLGMMLMRSILIVWQAVLISQMIISEYQTKTITMLFTYPYSRKGIICAKLILIGGIMTVAHIVTLFIQHMVIYLFSLTNPIILFSFQNPLSIIIITISSILLAFIPLAIGVKFKSTIATIITSLVIAAIVSNSQGSTAGILSNPIIAGVLGLCGLIVSIVTFRTMLKEDL